MKGRAELRNDFEAAKSAKGKLKVLNKMEIGGYQDLGAEYGKLAVRFEEEGKEPEQVLCYGKKALKFYLDCYNSTSSSESSSKFTSAELSLNMSTILGVMGSASFKLERFDESLSYLSWCERNLLKLEQDKSCPDYILLPNLLNTEGLLFELKLAMGRKEEVPIHIRKVLEIKQKTLDESSLELAEAYKATYMSYVGAMNFKEAHPFCMKALEIYSKHFSHDSEEMADMMRHLSNMCCAVGEYDKAHELMRLSESSLKKTGNSYEHNALQVEKGSMLMQSGRYKEAIKAFNAVVSLDGVEPCTRATTSLKMAEAYCNLGRFANAKKCIRIGLDVIEKIDSNEESSLFVVVGFHDVSKLYEKMDDFETAVSYTKRMLANPKLPQELLSQGSNRLYKLIGQTGKAEQEIPYIEALVEKLKEKFGPEHSEVGYAYLELGAAYIELGNPESAVKYMADAKHVMDAALGPHHWQSLIATQNLSVTYARMNRFALAIEIQEQVVEGFKGLGSSKQAMLDKAIRMLNKMKVEKAGDEVAEPPTMVSDQSKNGEDFQSKNSQCDILEDEMIEMLRLSESALKKVGNSYERNVVQVEKGSMLMHSGRYTEAIKAFNAVVSLDGVEPCTRATASLKMAEAYCNLGRFANAKKCIRISLDVIKKIDRNEESSLFVAVGFHTVSKLYEKMDDFETDVSYTKRMLANPKLTQVLLSQGYNRFYKLIGQTGKVEQEIPYIEALVEKLKEKFGPEHTQVGYACIHLGTAYIQSGNQESAAKYMAYAKHVMDVALGPHHWQSLVTTQNLSVTYALMNRFALAIEIQEQVVEGFKGLGGQVIVDDAIRTLNKMKADKAGCEVAEPPTTVSDQSKDGEEFQSKNPQSDILEDEMGAKLEDVKLKVERAGDEMVEPPKKVSDQSNDGEDEMVAEEYWLCNLFGRFKLEESRCEVPKSFAGGST